ncbi:MAG: efflux RND transporter periplasmic adaptor subunit [Gammaproteobacteria bacterium]|nr:efflux RND transporter periplasmic adaptor subunit [Gammaproteobacteria bacterium]
MPVFPALARLLLVLFGALAPLAPLVANGLAPVEVSMARNAPVLEALNLTGSLSSPRAARLAPAVAGHVVRVNVDVGARVQAGETLMELDGELAQLELAQARAAEREAQTELAEARRRLQEGRRLARNQSFAETEVRGREAEVARLEAVLERLRAVSAYDAALVARHSLVAPFAGVVAHRNAEVGEWVGTDTRVLELVAVDALHLNLQVPQAYFGRLSARTPVSVSVDARPDMRVDAVLSDIVPVSDPTARTFLVRALLDNEDGGLTPGMSARATLRIGVGREGIVVPRDALVRYPDGRTVVWVASGDGTRRRVEERIVRIGITSAEQVEIREGLAAGTAVVVRGNESLRQGQEVQVSEAR